MNPPNMRSVAIGAFLAAVILFMIDGWFVRYDQWYDGIGLLSTFIFPPIGIIAASIALKKTGSMKDKILILLNAIGFFLFFIWMFFGTLFFGP
ncbi:hypothetical protein [Paenibacillus apiarius]|uniref:hypothetical protein n=1 Tax=Paenibacillus apiarius TaxID=46240 RepID=UPI00197CCAE1|nr:hypothetical protein [Paenibacillus apiarius]MBN3526528.1 hypothetical protein [Paenibacillus apiarius]